MKPKEQDAVMDAFESGKVRHLVNADMLTTGVDIARIDCIVMLRASCSPGLWVQMLGRGTRPLYYPGYDINTLQGRLDAIQAGGKLNCLVLDFAGNTGRLGPINDPVIPKKRGKKTGEVPIKICETFRLRSGEGCFAYNHASSRVCCSCGGEFKFEVKITQEASKMELLAKKKKDTPEPITELFSVERVVYSVHKKLGVPDSLKVTYSCGLRQFTEYVPIWHPANIRHKAIGWWRKRTDIRVPLSAKDAADIADKLKIPVKIRVWVNKTYPEIINYEF